MISDEERKRTLKDFHKKCLEVPDKDTDTLHTVSYGELLGHTEVVIVGDFNMPTINWDGIGPFSPRGFYLFDL